MINIAIVLTQAPYGQVNAAEAIRHAMGAASEKFGVSLLLVDSGVLLSKKGHDVGKTGYTDLSDALADCIGMGVKAYAEKTSLAYERIDSHDMVGGVTVLKRFEIAQIIKDADTVMIF